MAIDKKRAYLLPADLEPDDNVCIRVYIPKADEYIAAFWGSMEYLACWLAWEKDPTHKAKIAADRWRQAVDLSREGWECANGECGIVDIRQSTTPCIVEKQVDCEGEWEPAVDMRLCVPKMRMVGGVLQQDTTGTGTWVDAGDPENPYDPRTDAPAPPPWTEPPPGQTGECLSAANVANYVNFAASSIADGMADGLLFFQTLGVAVTILTALMELIPLTLLTAFIVALYEQVIDSWGDVRDFDTKPKLIDFMVCKYSEDGSMNETAFNELIEQCETWRAGLTDPDALAKWWIVINLMKLWGPVGMTISGMIWGLTEYDCIPCNGWSYTFDFEVNDGGFEVSPRYGESWEDGVYTPGVGWTTEDGIPNGTSNRRELLIRKQFTDATITKVIVRHQFIAGTWMNEDWVWKYADYLNDAQLIEMPTNASEVPPDGTGEKKYIHEATVDEIEVWLSSCKKPLGSGWDGSVICKSITVFGTGANPFV